MTTKETAMVDMIDFRGTKVWFHKMGTGRPLLFLHNGGNSHAIWNRQLSHFANAYECFAFDLPGYGKSTNPSTRFTLRSYVDFLQEFMRRMEMERVILIGNCVGSAIALAHAMEKPESVERLVLFNVLTKSTIREGLLGPLFKLTAPVPFVRPLLRSACGGFRAPRFIAKYSVAMQYGKKNACDPRLDAQLCALYNQKGQVGALTDILVDIDAFDKFDRFRIPDEFPPVYVMWGQYNNVLPCQSGRRLVDTLRPKRFEVIEGAGHLAMYEAAEEVNARIEDFFSKTLMHPE